MAAKDCYHCRNDGDFVSCLSHVDVDMVQNCLERKKSRGQHVVALLAAIHQSILPHIYIYIYLDGFLYFLYCFKSFTFSCLSFVSFLFLLDLPCTSTRCNQSRDPISDETTAGFHQIGHIIHKENNYDRRLVVVVDHDNDRQRYLRLIVVYKGDD